jgi:hypothetical protein
MVYDVSWYWKPAPAPESIGGCQFRRNCSGPEFERLTDCGVLGGVTKIRLNPALLADHPASLEALIKR